MCKNRPEIERLKNIPMRKYETLENISRRCPRCSEDLKKRLRNLLIGYLRSQGYLDSTFFMDLAKRLPQSSKL
jgi:hypothetical protein